MVFSPVWLPGFLTWYLIRYQGEKGEHWWQLKGWMAIVPWGGDQNLWKAGSRTQGFTTVELFSAGQSLPCTALCSLLFGFVPRKKLKRKKRSLAPQKTFPSPGWWRPSSKPSTWCSWNHYSWSYCMTSSYLQTLSCWSKSPGLGVSFQSLHSHSSFCLPLMYAGRSLLLNSHFLKWVGHSFLPLYSVVFMQSTKI